MNGRSGKFGVMLFNITLDGLEILGGGNGLR